jgi:hypothetical protein
VNRRRFGAVLALATVVAGWPSVVAADPAGATDWRSQIVSFEPPNAAVELSIEGGDAFVRIVVAPGHEVVIEGYEGEPYLRIGADGIVYENRNSEATYWNATRDGSAPIPGGLDRAAPPEWSPIGDGGAWAWHDHRAHWMGDVAPPGVEPGDSLAPQVIPITVDGARSDLTVVTTRIAKASWGWASAGLLLGAATAAGLLAVRRLRPALIAGAGGLAVLAGAAQFGSLPAGTGRQLTWWLMPAIAVACGVTMIAIGRRAPLARHALTLVAASQLALWAWARRHHVRRGVLPTDLPFAIDRVITIAVAVTALALVVAAGRELSVMLRQPPSASSIRPSSAS